MNYSECFGKKLDMQKENCKNCEFLQSCQYAFCTEGRCETLSNHSCIEDIEGFAVEIATTPSVYDNDNSDNYQEYNVKTSTDELAQFLNFLLHLDNYTLGVLSTRAS